MLTVLLTKANQGSPSQHQLTLVSRPDATSTAVIKHLAFCHFGHLVKLCVTAECLSTSHNKTNSSISCRLL